VIVVNAYRALARRVGRQWLIATVYLFFASNLVVFAILARANVVIGVPFFLWVGCST
jgi:AAA family ATP:ADP antiporter